MPIVLVKALEGKTVDQKREIVKGITNVLTETAQVDPSTVRVLIEELPKENWSVAGNLVSDMEKKG